jgi:hypothetical protein
MSRFSQEVELRGFYELVADAFVYPFRREGKWLLLLAAVLFTASLALMWIPLFGWLLLVLVAGYLCAFMVRVVERSANGDPELPDLPDLSDMYEDVLRPLGLVVGTCTVAMLPAIVLALGHSLGGWPTQAAFSGWGWPTCRWPCSRYA